MFTDIEIKLIQLEMKRTIKKVNDALQNDNTSQESKQLLEEKKLTGHSIEHKLSALKEQNDKQRLATLNNKTPPKLLIVDDVKSMRDVTKQLAASIGFTNIDLAENGVQALQMLVNQKKTQTPYDLIICDWEMPKMTGFDLLIKLRNNEDFIDIPYFMLTSMGDIDHIKKAIDGGVTDYLVKPINQKVMHEKLIKYLPEK